jgi:universal stress protein A
LSSILLLAGTSSFHKKGGAFAKFREAPLACFVVYFSGALTPIRKGNTMKIKPTSKTGGVLVELGPGETQIPAQSVATTSEFRLNKILIPIDFSDCSKRALEYAMPFAKHFGAELNLLHVVEPYPAVPEILPYDSKTIDDSRQELQRIQKGLGDPIASSVSLRSGTPHLEIAAAAREGGADLIIIATHGRKGFSRFFLGSTTEKVVRYASCPVLIVRNCESQLVSNIQNSP